MLLEYGFIIAVADVPALKGPAAKDTQHKPTDSMQKQLTRNALSSPALVGLEEAAMSGAPGDESGSGGVVRSKQTGLRGEGGGKDQVEDSNGADSSATHFSASGVNLRVLCLG